MFANNWNTGSALGAALQAGYKLLVILFWLVHGLYQMLTYHWLQHPYGGRITVLQTTIPNIGPGALKFKDDDEKTTSQGKVKQNIFILYHCYVFVYLQEKLTLSPSSDFYKKLALECSAQQIGVDLFLMSSRYSDLTTMGW